MLILLVNRVHCYRINLCVGVYAWMHCYITFFFCHIFLNCMFAFSFIINLAKAIASKGAEAKNSFKRIAPSFFWLLRDALLQPVNSQGHPCNFKEYLSEMVSIFIITIILYRMTSILYRF